MSIKVRTVERKGRTFLEQLYLVEVVKGMTVTLGHFFRNLLDNSRLYVRHYPEVEPEITARWRGRHRLTRHEDGSLSVCVYQFVVRLSVCPRFKLRKDIQFDE